MFTAIIFCVSIVYVGSSLVYVYRFRGRERFNSLTEYLRKGWPIFSPLNCLLYLFTQRRAKGAILDLQNFPELNEIRENWQVISTEADRLYKEGYFDKTNKPDNKAYYDIGFRTFYKYGWSKFYVTWYGSTLKSAQELCPKTVEILSRVKSVKGAMFSILPVGSKLTRHLDPVAASLRYHLGLSTPAADPACFINVDGTSYSWRDGEAFMFDETYLHYAHNNAQTYRLILMCDVNRPTFLLGSIFNPIYRILMRMTVVPNMPGDRAGAVNTIFSALAPILQKSKKLRKTNYRTYLAMKYVVNTILLLLAATIFVGMMQAVQWCFESFF